MKILFTSDLHGDLWAFERFGNLLARDGYDIGIIAGDLQDSQLSKQDVAAIIKIPEGRIIEEPLGPEERSFKRSTATPYGRLVRQALVVQGSMIRNLLQSLSRPVLFVRGNHDVIDWPSKGNLVNLNQRSFKYFGYAFVGYEYTEFERDQDQQTRDLLDLEKMMKGEVILVTHAPPYGIMDKVDFDDEQGRSVMHVGSKALRDLTERRPVKLHLFGHVHSTFGIQGNCLNGSYSPIERKMMSIEEVEDGFEIRLVGETQRMSN
jgi:Icc-related predicted phosphoesterase